MDKIEFYKQLKEKLIDRQNYLMRLRDNEKSKYNKRVYAIKIEELQTLITHCKYYLRNESEEIKQ